MGPARTRVGTQAFGGGNARYHSLKRGLVYVGAMVPIESICNGTQGGNRVIPSVPR